MSPSSLPAFWLRVSCVTRLQLHSTEKSGSELQPEKGSRTWISASHVGSCSVSVPQG